ncbi:MAG: 2-dehydropantoate 2-reductase [Actinomycetota bacterium]|nr:2-dehydropantoate 2-reductase [Actinomycetota bacterium]
MKVLVVGTGGVGGYYGARLAAAGEDVWFMARGANLAALRQRGLEVRSDFGDLRLPQANAVERGSEAGPVDAVLFTVKTYDSEEAAAAAAGAVGEGTVICSLQNGVDNEAFLQVRFPGAVVIGGASRIEAFLESPGVVVQRGQQAEVTVGAFEDAARPAAEALAGTLERASVPVVVTDDVQAALWLKLLIICGLGSGTAYAGRPIGEVLASAELASFVERLMREVAAVAEARGIAVPPVAPNAVMAYARTQLDPQFKSSMLRDLEWGRPLEVEALNGAVVRYGREAGVPTPENQRVLEALLPLHQRAMEARRPTSTEG